MGHIPTHTALLQCGPGTGTGITLAELTRAMVWGVDSPLRAPSPSQCVHTHTHRSSPCLLGELCHLRPVQLPALSQLCGEGGQHDVLQQHRGAVPPSLQVLKGIRPKNRLEKSREEALRSCRTLNCARFYWN